ncbi:MAG: CapA family protein [Anaerovoracaceae bacterium]
MRSQQKKKNKRKFKRYLILCLALLVAITIGMISKGIKGDTAGNVVSPFEKNKEIDLSITCVGDVMLHMPQINAAYKSKTKEYNYDDNFEYVAKYIKNADLALCNMEVTFPLKPYQGYPAFRVPDALATAVSKAGFDVALTSNNHMNDSGADGLKRTAKVLKKEGLKVTGSRIDKEQKNYVVTEVKGVKVGVVSYTYANSANNNSVSINGNPLYGEDKVLANYFTASNIDEDLKRINKTVKAAEADGAELIILYYHWGEEYKTSPNELQKKIAKASAKMNVDIIYASHPHVLQNVDVIKVKDKDGKIKKEVPIYYSMGNFISNQNRHTLNNKLTEIGVLAGIDCTYDQKLDKITSFKFNAVPTWVNVYYKEGKRKYVVIPLDDKIKSNKSIKESGNANLAIKAREDGYEILGINKD